MDPIQIMIEEYKTLREEVLRALSHRLQIISFGLATIGVLIGSASLATMKRYETISALILLAGIPSVSSLILHIWLSEAHRARRASWYLWGLERKINCRVSSVVLQWEDGLREGHQSLALFRSHYYWVVAFFSLSASIPVALGMHQLSQPWLISVLFSIIIFLILVFPAGYRLRKFNNYDICAENWPRKENTV